MNHSVWTGCYDDQWRGMMVDEAHQHPAKYAPGLIARIYKHLAEHYGFGEGSVVVDPFGGVALGALGAMQHGAAFYGVELEAKFVDLAKQNIALWKRYFPQATAEIFQGDSRQLCDVLSQEAGFVVSSPPFSSPGCQPAPNMPSCPIRSKIRKMGLEKKVGEEYGQTPGQLGNLRPGDVDCVVSSPPFHNSLSGKGQCPSKRPDGSPFGQEKSIDLASYGTTPGQLASLPEGSASHVVSSPPFEASLPSGDTSSSFKKKYVDAQTGGDWGRFYGDTKGNIGNDTAETFWSAARTIIQQSHAILRPAGIAVWVVKAFVRNKQIVDFPGDWQRLCEACGFETLEEIHASLVKEDRHPSLFGGEVVSKKQRKSFFRRLAEAKGSPQINHEVVLIMRKPSDPGSA